MRNILIGIALFLVVWGFIFQKTMVAFLPWLTLALTLVALAGIAVWQKCLTVDLVKQVWEKVSRWKKLWLIPLVFTLLAVAFFVFYSRTHGGLPWLYWCFWIFAVLTAVNLIVASMIWPDQVGKPVAYAIGRWINRGGFWKFWSCDNLPANSLVVLWLGILFVTVLYGPPTPQLSMAELSIYGKGIGSWLKEGLDTFRWGEMGSPVVDAQESAEPAVGLTQQYIRGWFWISLTFLTSPSALLGLVFSRRDEAAEIFTILAEKIKKIREDGATSVAVGSASEAAPALAGAGTAVAASVASHGFRKLFASDMLAEVSIRGLEWLAKIVR